MSFTYDSLSRVLTETQGSNALGSTGKTVTYTYDDDGNRTKTDYPGSLSGTGFSANETREALGRLTEVTDASNVWNAALHLCGPDARKKRASFGNSATVSDAGNCIRRSTEIVHGVIEFSRAGPVGTDVPRGVREHR